MPPHDDAFDPQQFERELGDRYQVVRVLGRGAFGTVYLARERLLHRLVVIKALNPELAGDEQERTRLLREARTVAQLSHPAIVPLLAYGETETTVYMVMPYVSGETLAERLRREGGRLDYREVRRLLIEIADALAYAHSEGVLHRDLKPENILLERAGALDDDLPPRVRLIDFGVAAFPTRDPGVSPTYETWGTPQFMAPEQAFGEPEMDPRSELYSLGVLGFLLLGGRLPFEATSPTERLTQQRAGPAVPLAAAAPGAPPDLVAAIERCLEYEPGKRWRRARELRDALAVGVASDHGAASAASLVRHLAPRRRRRARREPRLGAATAASFSTYTREALMESLVRDLRYVTRSLLRTPAFFAVTALTLALGIGATTAIFTVIDSVLLRPLPYPDPERIVHLWQVNAYEGRVAGQNAVSDPNFEDWQAQSRSFAAMAQVGGAGLTSVAGASEPVRVRAAVVSRDFFSVMGVRPVRGRTFVAEEQRQGATPTVVVGYGFWQRYLNADPSVIGTRTLTFQNRVHTIVGVMPPELSYPVGTELWTPRELEARTPSRTAHNSRVVARLAPGVTLEQARAELSAVSRRLKQELGDQTRMVDAAVVPLREQLTGRARPALLILLGASAVLLLIACANVVNLLIARMAARQGEIALRLALGAGRGRLARQFLTEALVLSVVGGVLGVLLAVLGGKALLAMEPGNLPRLSEIGVSWPVLGFALGVSVLTALAMGLMTALRGTAGDLRDALSQAQRTQSGGGSSYRIRGALVVAQVAMTLVLLVGAGLLARSFVRLLSVDPGYRTERAVVLDMSLPIPTNPDETRQLARVYDELLARLATVPGVAEAGVTNTMPLGGSRAGNGTFLVMTGPDEQLTMEDFGRLFRDPSRTGEAEFRIASAGYFRAMNIPLVRGRLFDDRDAPDAPHVAVISQSLVKARWPNEDPIGKTIQFGNMDGDLRPFTIVGVVGDVREASLAVEPAPTFYAYYRQRPRQAYAINAVIQGSAEPAAIIAAARTIVRELRPDVPPRFRTIETVIAESVADRRFMLLLVGVFGVSALLLATLGVYSVISYLVTQRKQEIGIRVALGAQTRDVVRMVLRQGATLVLAGIVVGALAALGLTRFVTGMLFGISPNDPVAFAGVIAVLGGVALLASFVPARRASRVEPMQVLRGS